MTIIATVATNLAKLIKQSSPNTSVKDFTKFFESALGNNSAREVSEEELFASSVHERVMSLKGSDVITSYESAFNANNRRPDGRYQYEIGAVKALEAMVAGGQLTQAEANNIYSQAFQASQLDSNTDILWDNTGSATDPTKAVSAQDAAITKIAAALADMASGKVTAQARTIGGGSGGNPGGGGGGSTGGVSNGTNPITGNEIKINGSTIDGEGGFLYKPVSDNQGKLAILLPTMWRYEVDAVRIFDIDGNQVDVGYSTGYGETGEREKFTFNYRGDEYPADILVEITMRDGTKKTMKVGDPSQRYD